MSRFLAMLGNNSSNFSSRLTSKTEPNRAGETAMTFAGTRLMLTEVEQSHRETRWNWMHQMAKE
jgi:hypothetical protein